MLLLYEIFIEVTAQPQCMSKKMRQITNFRILLFNNNNILILYNSMTIYQTYTSNNS